MPKLIALNKLGELRNVDPMTYQIIQEVQQQINEYILDQAALPASTSAQSSTRWFDPVDFGADPKGVSDSTTAIAKAIAAAAAATPPGEVHFSSGTYLTSGGFDLNGLNGLTISGAGVGSTTLKINHATNDFFSSTGQLAHVGISGITFDASVARTGGWCFRHQVAPGTANYLSRTRFRDIEFINQLNGFWVSQYEFVWFTRVFGEKFAANTGIAFKVGQANAGAAAVQTAEIYYDQCQLDGNTGAFGTGYWFEDCDAVYMVNCGGVGAQTGNLNIVSNTAGAGAGACHNHFYTQCVFDGVAAGSTATISGAGTAQRMNFTGCWFASAQGTTSAGLSVTSSLLDVRITGSIFYNNQGNGLLFFPLAGAGDVNGAVSGCTFNANGGGGVADNNNGIGVAVAGTSRLTFTGNYETGSNNDSIKIYNSSTGVTLSANAFTSKVEYLAAPKITPLVLFRQTADAVTTPNVATTLFGTGLGSLTLPANLLAAGVNLRVMLGGYVSVADGVAGAKTLAFSVGGTNVALGGSTANFASVLFNGWNAQIWITCRTAGAPGTVEAGGWFNLQGATVNSQITLQNVGATNITTTGALVLNLTYNNGAAVGTLTTNFAVVEVL